MKKILIAGLVVGLLLLPLLQIALADRNASALTVDKNRDADFVDMFEEVWRVYDEYYPYFVQKSINWDSLHAVFLPQFKSCRNESSFIQILIEALGHLRDFHVGLRLADGTTIGSTFAYPRPIRYNMDWSCLPDYFPDIKEMETLFYGISPDNIGYIAIPGWSPKVVAPFNSVLEKLKNTRGLIIDVRMNAGGSELAAQQVASRFANRTANYAYHQFREGSQHDDFGVIGTRTISPGDNWQYLKPVAVLIGVVTMSSSESFVMMMHSFDHITTTGEPSRGCSGNPIELALPIGIKYSVPRWKAYRSDFKVLEGHGIEPDYHVAFSDRNRADGVDPVIEKAKKIINLRVDIQQLSGIEFPEKFELEQNYPNPFNSSTTIKYSLKHRSKVRLSILNALGQEIFSAINELQESGTYSVDWNGYDKYGRSVTSGVYFYQIQANKFNDVKKMILLR